MKREYPKHPIAAVGVVVFNDDHVLLVKRNKPPKSYEWSIPGGAQELGEPLKDTAVREVFEETSIKIKNLTLLDAVDFIKKDEQGSVEYHYSLIDYSADYVNGELEAGDDAIEAKWVSIKSLNDYKLWSETINLIKNAIEQRKRCGENE